MKNFICIIIVGLLVNCKPSKEEAVFVDTAIGIYITDREGSDLLDSSKNNSIKEKDVKMYYLVNGKKEEFFDGHLHNPKGFSIGKNHESGKYILTLHPNISGSDKIRTTTTYIELGVLVIDTIECTIEDKGSITECTKILVNKELKWDGTFGRRNFTIVK